jgi:hypothetical protein
MTIPYFTNPYNKGPQNIKSPLHIFFLDIGLKSISFSGAVKFCQGDIVKLEILSKIALERI